jgi:hypothetical protein
MSDIRQIAVKGTKVGLVGLKQAFEQVSSEGRAGDAELGARLVELVAANNYIADSVRDDYRSALVREYRRFQGLEVPAEETVLEIKVFGRSKCTICSGLSEEIMDVMAELGIAADFEHVTDLNRFAELGPVAPPVVVKNGKIVSSGRRLNRAQIKDMLTEASE